MDNAMAMKMLQPLARLSAHGRNLTLCHQVRRDHIRQTPALHVLHHDPKIVLVQKGVNIVYNVWVPGRTHDQDLVDDKVFLGLLIEVHLLDRHRYVRTYLVCCVHTTRGPVWMGQQRQKIEWTRELFTPAQS